MKDIKSNLNPNNEDVVVRNITDKERFFNEGSDMVMPIKKIARETMLTDMMGSLNPIVQTLEASNNVKNSYVKNLSELTEITITNVSGIEKDMREGEDGFVDVLTRRFKEKLLPESGELSEDNLQDIMEMSEADLDNIYNGVEFNEKIIKEKGLSVEEFKKSFLTILVSLDNAEKTYNNIGMALEKANAETQAQWAEILTSIDTNEEYIRMTNEISEKEKFLQENREKMSEEERLTVITEIKVLQERLSIIYGEYSATQFIQILDRKKKKVFLREMKQLPQEMKKFKNIAKNNKKYMFFGDIDKLDLIIAKLLPDYSNHAKVLMYCICKKINAKKDFTPSEYELLNGLTVNLIRLFGARDRVIKGQATPDDKKWRESKFLQSLIDNTLNPIADKLNAMK